MQKSQHLSKRVTRRPSAWFARVRLSRQASMNALAKTQKKLKASTSSVEETFEITSHLRRISLTMIQLRSLASTTDSS